MSAKILEFKNPEPVEQTGFGLAFCFDCSHEWEAVAPTGTVDMECPNCGCMKGRYKYGFQPEVRRVCNCGNDLFHLTREGHLCPRCGIYQRYDNE